MKKFTIIILPVALAFIGVALWGVGFFSLLNSTRRIGMRIAAPGTTVVTITNIGGYTLWNETKGLMDGEFKSFSDAPPKGLVMKVTKKSDGTQIPLTAHMTGTLTSNGTRKVSLASVTFDAPGDYVVDISGISEKRTFYLSETTFGRTFLTFFILGICGLFFVIAAIASGIYALVKILK